MFTSTSVGLKTFVNIPGAQYLGPAITSGAVYIASMYDRGAVEILCITGNRAMEKLNNENVPIYTVSVKSGNSRRCVLFLRIYWFFYRWLAFLL